MERNSTIGAWRLPGGINSAADKGVSAMILSYHDSVPPTFADKQVNAYGPLPSAGAGPSAPSGDAAYKIGRFLRIERQTSEIRIRVHPRCSAVENPVSR
jgi:hypothetical protein